MSRSGLAAAVLMAGLAMSCSSSDPPGNPPSNPPDTPPADPPTVHALPDGQLRVVTWNIRFFPEPGTDAERVARYLVALDADLIGVQEIADRNALASLLAQVNDTLAGRPAGSSRAVRNYAVELASSGGHGSQYVGLVYDRNAISLSGVETLPRLQMTDDLRPGLHAVATSSRGGVDFHVIVVHNDSGTEDRDYQNRQRFLDSLRVEVAGRQGTDADILVLGDFNTMGRAAAAGLSAIPAEQEIADLDAEVAGMGVQRIHSSPACSEYYRGEPGLLDHVLATTAMQEVPGSPISRVVGFCAEAQCRQLDPSDMPYDYAHVSDHCPVVIDLTDQDLD